MTDRSQQKIVALATGVFAVAYLLGTSLSSGLSKPIVQGDARSYFAYLPSIVLDGDLDLTNQFDHLRPEGGDPRYPFGVGANGYAANLFPAGPALLWLPGYVVGLGFDAAAGAIDLDTGPIGYGLFAAWGAALSSIVLAGVGAELSRRIVREFFGLRYALPATLTVWLGTPAIYYTMVAPLYSHAVAWFAAALTLWLGWIAFHDPGSRWRWFGAGAAGGLLISIRLQDAPVLLVTIGLVLLAHPSTTELLRSTAALIAGGVVGYLPQAWVWYTLHGELIPRQGLGEPGPFVLSRLGAILFSTGYEGWLSWTPLAGVALAGLLLIVAGPFPAGERSVAVSALVATTALVVIDVIHPYGQGAAFGARRYVTVTPFLILGTAGAAAWLVGNERYLKPGFALIGGLALANLWLFVAYEVLIMRHGHYGNLVDTWRYALGLWGG